MSDKAAEGSGLSEAEVEAFARIIDPDDSMEWAKGIVRRIAARAAEVERERAVKIAEGFLYRGKGNPSTQIAAAIRAPREDEP